jgi:transposase-like protein
MVKIACPKCNSKKLYKRSIGKDAALNVSMTSSLKITDEITGGQWKNKRKTIRDHGTKRGRGTKKQPLFGFLCRNGQVWAEVVDDVEPDTLQPLISRKVSTGSTICSDTWKAYTGITARRYVHRLVNNGEKRTMLEKEIILIGWRDSGVFSNKNSQQKVE